MLALRTAADHHGGIITCVNAGYWPLIAALLLGVAETTCAQPSTDVLGRQWVVGVEQGEQQVVFGSIREIAYHPDHGLYVLDTGLQTVHRYDTKGHRTGGFEYRRGEGPGELVQQHSVPSAPTRVAPMQDRIFLAPFWLTSDSTLYVSAPDGSGRYGILPRPEQWKTTAMTGNFERLEVTPEGTLLRSLPYPYRLTEVDPSGTVLREASGHPTFDAPEQSGGASRMQEGARGLALLETGQVVHLILDRAEERVYLDLFSRDLTFQERIDITGELPSAPLPSLEAGSGSTLYFWLRNPYAQVAAYTLKL